MLPRRWREGVAGGTKATTKTDRAEIMAVLQTDMHELMRADPRIQ